MEEVNKGMNLTIKRAIEGGYKLPWITKKQISSMRHRGNYSVVLLDPEFWQCLEYYEHWIEQEHPWQEPWLYQQHKLIDHLANKGSIDEFFKKLLK